MTLELIFIELLLGAMLLGFLGSFKKRILDRVILLATVPIAFIIALLASKGITAADAAELGFGAIETGNTPQAIEFVANALVLSLTSPFLATVIFWILLLAMRIFVGIVLTVVHTVLGTRRRERKNGKKRSLTNKLVTAGLGVVSGFLVCMLSFLPIVYVNDLVDPAMETAKSEEFEGTYVNEVATELDKVGLPFSKGTVLSGVATVTGMRGIYNITLRELTDTSFTRTDGTVVEFNALELVNSISSDGIRLLALYEASCDADTTLGDFAAAGDILRGLSESELLMALTADVLTNMEAAELTEDAEFGDKMMHFVSTEYTTGDSAIIKNEVLALASLMDLLTDDLADVKLTESDALPAILDYIEVKDNSERMVDTICESTLYNQGFPIFMEFGLELICDQMNLSKNKEADYARYLADMKAVFNDKSVATYDRERAESFIKYCADNGVQASTYAINDRENMTNIDRDYESYIRFYSKMRHIETVFIDYCVWEEDFPYLTYQDGNGSFYYYLDAEYMEKLGISTEGNDLVGRWFRDSDEFRIICTGAFGDQFTLSVNPVSLAASMLTHEINVILAKDNTAITNEQISDMASSIIRDLGTADDIKTSLAVLESLVGIDGYNAAPAYREDILAALHKDVPLVKEEVAANISLIASIWGDLTEESDEASHDTVMDHFVDIGAMLDSLDGMETTKDIPEVMLDVIMRDKNYGRYFRVDPVKSLVDETKSGNMTYTELFTEVTNVYRQLKAVEDGTVN